MHQVELLHKRHTVFVGGAADDYAPWDEAKALELCAEISATLIKSKYRIVNGLGLGIGSAIVEGALREIYRNQRTKLTDQLQIRPFPQSDDAKKLWTRYREDMLDYSGVSIFLFGNKYVDGQLVLSNGIQEEFDIAVAKGVIPIPLGFTGYMAEKLWLEVSANFSKYFPSKLSKLEPELLKLGDKSRSEQEHIQTLQTILTSI